MIKKVGLVSNSNGEIFIDEVLEMIDGFQKEGYHVDIQFSGCEKEFSAFIVARIKEQGVI